MNPRDDSAIIRHPTGGVAKVKQGTKRILSDLVRDILSIAQEKSQTQSLPATSSHTDADLESWYWKGEAHYYGTGVPKDYVEAVKCYRNAAERGHAHAQFRLGVCYSGGEGVLQDHAQAVNWYRKAAEQGYADAQNNLGHCYYDGCDGVPVDKEEGLRWLSKSAENGCVLACITLDTFWKSGLIDSKDHEKVLHWLRRAIEKGDSIAVAFYPELKANLSELPPK